jgi:hypothetical protein
MGGAQVRRTRAGRATALGAAALALLLLLACPAPAARQKVVGGSTTLTVPGAKVAELGAADAVVIDVAPLTFRYLWDGAVSWSFRAPMAAGGSYDHAAKKGTLVHKGGLRFVNLATGANLPLTGLRISVDGPSHVVLQAAVGGPPLTRAEVMVASATAEPVKKGRQVVIRDVRFRLTPQLAVALQTALVGTFDTTTVFAVGDLRFTLK